VAAVRAAGFQWNKYRSLYEGLATVAVAEALASVYNGLVRQVQPSTPAADLRLAAE
jgi:hypothetical protein